MPNEDKYFHTMTDAELWQRYCGFLDLSVDEFMEVQNDLLMDQIARVADSVLGRKIMGPAKPKSMKEFRRVVPITTYSDYEPYLSERRDDALADKPVFWCHSSGLGGVFKWIPFNKDSLDAVSQRYVALMILASARRKGEINVAPGERLLLHLAPPPYISGSALKYIQQQGFSLDCVPPLKTSETMAFPDRIAKGFEIAMRTGIGEIFSLASVLVKVGEEMAGHAQKTKFSVSMLHPAVILRVGRALLRSKLEGRPMLPKDLWHPKGIMTCGTDTTIYKDAIKEYWGQTLFEIIGGTEVFPVAANAWNKKWLAFEPSAAFFEFIPEGEWQKIKDVPGYQPATVLVNGLEVGKNYEVVITHFRGMPLLRYRLGDIVTVKALSDEEVGIKLPQVIFKCRADEMIHLAGLAKLDEKILWRAITGTGFKCEEWTARKEHHSGQAYLAVYLEPKDGSDGVGIEKSIDEQLRAIDPDYRDIGFELGLQPVRVTLLSKGTFNNYFEEMRKQGADPAHMKPRHINVSDEVIGRLVQISGEGHKAA